jgi:hypothetical protein
MFATEERFRLIDLQTTALPTETQALVWNGAGVTVDFASPPANPVYVHAGLKWMPYHHTGEAWQPVSAEAYLTEIERRYPLSALITEAGETESDAEGKQFAYQLYYLTLLNGVVELVQIGSQPIRHTFKADTGIASYIKSSPSAINGVLKLAVKVAPYLIQAIREAANTSLINLLALGYNTLYSHQNLKVHPHSERLYAALPTAGDDRIWRLSLDGSDPEWIITRTIPGDILAVALTRDYLYWIEANGGSGALLRADLDGSDVTTLTTALNSPVGLAADPSAGVVFVAENAGGRIRFYAESGESGYMDPVLEGSPPQPIVQVLLFNGMAVDPQARMLYVTGERTGSGGGILRIPYPPAWNGAHTYTEATLVVPSSLYLGISGLAVDAGGGNKLYFGTLTGSSPYTVTVRRANLDGSDPEVVYTAADHRSWTLSLDLDINHPPTATTQIVQVTHNTPVTFTLDASDPNGNPLRFTLLRRRNTAC